MQEAADLAKAHSSCASAFDEPLKLEGPFGYFIQHLAYFAQSFVNPTLVPFG